MAAENVRSCFKIHIVFHAQIVTYLALACRGLFGIIWIYLEIRYLGSYSISDCFIGYALLLKFTWKSAIHIHTLNISSLQTSILDQ